MFSQSFDIGDTTFQNLENAEAGPSTLAAPADLEVIEESPTNKTTFRSYSSNHRSRLRSVRPKKRTDKLNRSKSDSALDTSTSSIANSKSASIATGNAAEGNGNYSELFKCSIDFELNLAEIPLVQQQKLPTQTGNLSQFFESDFVADSHSIFDASQLPMEAAAAKSVLEQPISSDDIANLSIDNWNDGDDFKAPTITHVRPTPPIDNADNIDGKIDTVNGVSMFDVSDFIDQLSIDEGKSVFDQPISTEDIENLSIDTWDDCDAFDSSENRPQSPSVVNLTIADDDAALGLDNVTFTQDFLQVGQPDLNRSDAISLFVESELINCRQAMQADSNEILSEVDRTFTCNVPENSSKISNIVLNISDSSEPDSVSLTAIKEDNQKKHKEDDNNIQETEKAISPANLNSIKSWGLPETVVNEYKKKKIETMFDWQCNCLSNKKVAQVYHNDFQLIYV